MKPTQRIIVADVMEGLAEIPDGSVDCVATSPPYYGGIRDYGTASWDGGDPECDHRVRTVPHLESVGLDGGKGTQGHQQERYRDVCGKCGAKRVDKQLGHEATPEEYVERMVGIGREWRRVLKPTGVVLVNIGDAYAGSWGNYGGQNRGNGSQRLMERGSSAPVKSWDGREHDRPATANNIPGLKPGDLMLVPQRLALAFQADGAADPAAMAVLGKLIERLTAAYETYEDIPAPVRRELALLEKEHAAAHHGGWYVRSWIVWAKGTSFVEEWAGSVMPESVNGVRWERCRVKVARKSASGNGYVPSGWDAGEGVHGDGSGNYSKDGDRTVAVYEDCPGCEKCRDTGGYVLRRGSWRPTNAHEYVIMLAKSPNYVCDQEAVREAGRIPAGTVAAYGSGDRYGNRIGDTGGVEYEGTRNIRTVWSDLTPNMGDVWYIGTKGTKLKHYATFPDRFAETLVRMGTSRMGCCPSCGAPWVPVVEKSDTPAASHKGSRFDTGKTGSRDGGDRTQEGDRFESRVTGWRPMCSCPAHEPVPCTVLDPFSGSGTTGVACVKLGRNYVGIELNPEYAAMSEKRLADAVAEVEAERCRAEEDARRAELAEKCVEEVRLPDGAVLRQESLFVEAA